MRARCFNGLLGNPISFRACPFFLNKNFSVFVPLDHFCCDQKPDVEYFYDTRPHDLSKNYFYTTPSLLINKLMHKNDHQSFRYFKTDEIDPGTSSKPLKSPIKRVTLMHSMYTLVMRIYLSLIT